MDVSEGISDLKLEFRVIRGQDLLRVSGRVSIVCVEGMEIICDQMVYLSINNTLFLQQSCFLGLFLAQKRYEVQSLLFVVHYLTL